MEISIFLAKVVGWYLIITAVLLLLRYKTLRRDITTFTKQRRGLMQYFFGAYSLIIGLLIVSGHNIWEADYRVVITIIGWLALIKGIAYFILPWKWFKSFINWTGRSGWMIIWAVIGLIVGAYVLNEVTSLF